jgi:GNAT superfamily N-acetyltransferase
MENIIITEIISSQLNLYKPFFIQGLVNESENFRIALSDDLDAPFPTGGRPDSFTLGAYINERLAGVVSFERDGATREKLRHKGVLFRMYVSDEYRGKGLGRALIHSVIEKARELKDIEQINLTVISHNKSAKMLYERLGFTIFSREEKAQKWKGKYATEEQMVLFL